MRDYKLVVLGAGGVGKSCLTVQFVQGIYIDSYDPTIEDSYTKEIEVDGRACNLEILDTAGVAQFTAMRELYIKNGQGFLLVYSVTDKQSLQELLAIREQILRIKDSSNVSMVLVGNKCDLTNERELTPEDGIEVSRKWNKVPFYETSALYRMNVDDAFVDVVRQIIRKEVQQTQPGHAHGSVGAASQGEGADAAGSASASAGVAGTGSVAGAAGGSTSEVATGGVGTASGKAVGSSAANGAPIHATISNATQQIPGKSRNTASAGRSSIGSSPETKKKHWYHKCTIL